MLLKIVFVVAISCLAVADNTLESINEAQGSQSVQFETSHKNPDSTSDDAFQTAHKISPFYLSAFTGENADFGGLRFLRSAMNFAPTQARPALDPVLSALINEDVRKSIEAKRAIEQEELDAVRAEIDVAVAKAKHDKADETSTKAAHIPLTTARPVKKANLDDDINVGFVDQTISLDTAGSENNKKSRIEIKKGPNGQEYEYEYVYYYEDEDDVKTKSADTAAAQTEDSNLRGKSRYSSIDRSSSATPTENSLTSGKAKGRSSNVNTVVDEIELERLPAHTRFPNRGKTTEVQPTPAIDVQQEKKKISVKRPSLELVDSEIFNTDEKQIKGSPRNGDTEATNKPAPIAQEQPARVEAISIDKEETATAKIEADAETATTVPIQKAPFDLYAISINEKLNSDLTTIDFEAATTPLPESTDSDDNLTTLMESLPSSTTTTTTTTTTTSTTTEAPTTTAKPGKPSLFGNRRPGLTSARLNRNKSKSAGDAGSTTTEAPAEQPKSIKNRFSRPSIGGRNRPPAKTTAAPAPSGEEEEEKIEVKEVKPVSSGFARSRPRNRFNLRGSTTVKPEESADNQQEEVSSTTARSLRSRPTLNLRGRTRASTTKAPTTEEETNKEAETEGEAKPSAAPSKTSRYNLNRPGGNRLLPRGKLARTTELPTSEDSAADSSHHNDIKNEEHHENDAEQTRKEEIPATGGNLNRLKTRNRVNLQQKSEKPKAAPAPVPPRKVNPLLAKRRLQLGASTTEAAPLEESVGTSLIEETEAKESTNSTADENESAKEESTEETETTTKQARGLGLLGQRRRLPLRKPGTIL